MTFSREIQSRPPTLTPTGKVITPCDSVMAGTPEGRVESIHEGRATPPNDLNDEVEGDAGAPPHL